MYNLAELHDPTLNYNGIIPYRSPEYISVYDGITVEMHIVDHCNLNCAGCNHFSPLAQPWEIDITYFEEQLLELKNNIQNVKRLILLGGEPTIHSQFIEICLKARKIFPDINIDVLSNGVNLKKIKTNFDQLIKNNIHINICNYLEYTDAQTVQELKLPYFNSRHLMHQTLVDDLGKQNIQSNFFYCGNYTLPCFTLKDFKLYICPFSAHFNIYANKQKICYTETEGIDYLNIKTIQGNLDKIQDFCFTPKNYCAYCKKTNSAWIWQKSYKDTKEFNTDLKEMYLTDYSRYEKMTNTNFNYFLNNYTEKNLGPVDYVYCPDIQEKLLVRLGLGKMDIVIPHYNTSEDLIQRLLKSLSEQTIIKDCVIYLVSDCSPKDKDIIQILNIFSNLNIVLLKTPIRGGPGNARNYGINFGYNKYILFFDSDDYFINPTSLEEFYKKMEEGSDALFFLMHNYKNNRTCPLVRREFIIENNIKYLPIYFGEDMIFINSIKNKTNNIFEYNNSKNLFAYYDIDVPSSLTNTFFNIDSYHLNFITSKFWIIKKEKVTKNLIQDLYNFVEFNRQILTNDLMKTYIYYILYNIYMLYPDLYFDCCKNDGRANDYINQTLYVTLKDKILTSEKEIIDYLKINFLNISNPFLIEAAKINLKLLEDNNEFNL